MRVLAACLLLVAAPAGRGTAAETPSAAYEDMAVDLLRQYLRIDTTVPPGNELRGARTGGRGDQQQASGKRAHSTSGGQQKDVEHNTPGV